MSGAPRAERGEELQRLLLLDRSGTPAILARSPEAQLVILALDDELGRITIGRHSCSAMCLAWDPEVSRTHAVLERVGFDWWLLDEGLSRNGTFVNGRRIAGRHRLTDGDVIRVGRTPLTFRYKPEERTSSSTAQTGAVVTADELTPAQLRVLRALCRPYKGGNAIAAPAPNQQIADELVVSLDAVKSHMRGLFERFAVEDLPQNAKRARLAELAFDNGLIRESDL